MARLDVSLLIFDYFHSWCFVKFMKHWWRTSKGYFHEASFTHRTFCVIPYFHCAAIALLEFSFAAYRKIDTVDFIHSDVVFLNCCSKNEIHFSRSAHVKFRNIAIFPSRMICRQIFCSGGQFIVTIGYFQPIFVYFWKYVRQSKLDKE